MTLGNVFMTIGIQNLLEAKALRHEQLAHLLVRHENGDYGIVEQDSVEINKSTIKSKLGTVLSSYNVNNINIWIITTMNYDEVYTTILLPKEY